MFETVSVSAAEAVLGEVRKADDEFPVLDGAQLQNAVCVYDSGTILYTLSANSVRVCAKTWCTPVSDGCTEPFVTRAATGSPSPTLLAK